MNNRATVEIPLEDRDDVLTVTAAVWPGDYPGQVDTLEIEHASVTGGPMPSRAEIERLLWVRIKERRSEV